LNPVQRQASLRIISKRTRKIRVSREIAEPANLEHFPQTAVVVAVFHRTLRRALWCQDLLGVLVCEFVL
jgi:hypothetical protein